MNILEDAFKAAIVMADDIGKVLNLTNKLLRMGDVLSDDDKRECWQEISRIAAENAAKPSIDGVSEHP